MYQNTPLMVCWLPEKLQKWLVWMSSDREFGQLQRTETGGDLYQPLKEMKSQLGTDT